MKKTNLIGLAVALVALFVCGALFVSAQLEPKETVLNTVGAQEACGACDCGGQCGGSCGSSACHCSG